MFLKNKNNIFKIRGSKVTDYAALITIPWFHIKLYLDYEYKKSRVQFARCAISVYPTMRDLPKCNFEYSYSLSILGNSCIRNLTWGGISTDISMCMYQIHVSVL